MRFFVLFSASLFISCGDDNDSIEETNPGADTATGEVTLYLSKSLIEADGKDVTVFTVMQGGVDVTHRATIYHKVNGKWAVYKATEFSTDVEGSYEFSADHNDVSSETVWVVAATGISELPADPNPTQYDNFCKNVLAMQFTGVTCGYCPYVINAIENFLPMENAKNTVFAALHSYDSKDPMYSDDAWKVASNMGIGSYPTMMYNMEIKTDASNTTAEGISNIVDDYMAVPANSAISASVMQDGSATDGKLKVQGAVKIAEEGTYYLSVWLLEDSIKSRQTNYDNIPIGDIHNNTVRLCNTTNPFGAQFGGRSNWKAGEMGVFYHEFDLKNAKIKNLDNCHVVVYVTRNTQGSFFVVDNVIDCKVGEVKSFEYKK